MIYKYKLELRLDQEIDLPKEAKILTVSVQLGGIYLYAMVDPNAIEERRFFRIVLTGEYIDPKIEKKYIGSIQFENPNTFFHVFEIFK